jgi:hypothetical protein
LPDGSSNGAYPSFQRIAARSASSGHDPPGIKIISDYCGSSSRKTNEVMLSIFFTYVILHLSFYKSL